MEANTRRLERIFDPTIVYQIPLFQRPYVWTEAKNWQPLWEDIQPLLEKRLLGHQVHPHFLGAVVLEQLPNATGAIESRQVIDGQQRFTTLQIMLIAARDCAYHLKSEKHAERFNDLVCNRRTRIDRDEEAYKLWPTNSDRRAFRMVHTAALPSALDKLVRGSKDPLLEDSNVINAYRYFFLQLDMWVKGAFDDEHSEEESELLAAKTLHERFDAVWDVVKDCLQLVVIDLDKEDETQVIFETLNARGEDLLPADLIKNFLFRKCSANGDDVERLYVDHWQSFETAFWRDQVKQGRLLRPRLDVFINYYLALMTRDEVKSSHLFQTFKAYVHSSEQQDDDSVAVSASDHVRQLAKFGHIFRGMTLPEQHQELDTFLRRLEAVDTTTVFPFLLHAYAELMPDRREEFNAVLRVLESYLVRRMICNLTTKNYNRLFLELIKAVANGPGSLAERTSQFLSKGGGDSARFPDDGEVLQILLHQPLYGRLGQAKVRAILEALDLSFSSAKSEYQSLPPNLTIEHVMPQAWQRNWPIPNADELDPVALDRATARREVLLNTIGNLTLVTGSLNPALSNASWVDKQVELLRYAKANLNRYFTEDAARTWDETAIEKRSRLLAQHVVSIWPSIQSATTARKSVEEVS